MGNLAAVTLGATMVYPGEGFDPLATLQTIEQEKCTALYGVPTMFIAELDHPEFAQFDLSSLRTGIMAGAPCPIEVMKRVNRRDEHARGDHRLRHDRDQPGQFPERAPTIRWSGGCRPSDASIRMSRSRWSISKAASCRAASAASSAPAATASCWAIGTRRKRPPTCSTPTAGCTPATSPSSTHEGYCNIVGRIKDMVIRGGENLYPREIEEFLYRHPKIQDVQIFGVADDRYGEELCAWIRDAAGRDADGRRGPRLLPGPDRPQQDPALRRIRRRISDDRDRQDPEVRDARGGRERSSG